ncbi:MAG: helix-turn-helix domain-containing protein [Acidobacteriaceae bacterium]
MQTSFDTYVLDVLMRDLTEHDKRPSAFIVYLYVWRQSRGAGQRTVSLSYQQIAEGTGLSKSAVQGAVSLLRRRKLLSAARTSPTSTPLYRVERPWARRKHPR